MVDLSTISLLLPEMTLLILAAWIYVGGTLTRSRVWWTSFALLSYVAVAVMLWRHEPALWQAYEPGQLVGPLVIDGLGQGGRQLAVLVGFVLTLLAYRGATQELASEYVGSLMLLVVGLMLVARANDLVLMFVALELISIPTYVLLFLGNRKRSGAESTTKYFFLSLLSSGLLLYGASMLYGLGGTTTITGDGVVPGIRDALLTGQSLPLGLEQLAPLAMVLVFAGLGFKIAAVPFQFYAPDVYQGTSNPNAGLLAVVPKIAGIVALVRLVLVAMPMLSTFGWQLAMVIAILTMTIGNVCALWQTNIRRLLAYSSIAHGGYLLIGLAVAMAEQGEGGIAGVAAMLVYLLVYSLATLGTFAALAYLGNGAQEVDRLEQLAGLGRRQPTVAAGLAIFMFSLAGIPPLAGFWGKLTLFTGAIGVAANGSSASPWFVVLAIAGALNAAIAAAYYLRVISVMYFRPSAADAPRANAGWGALLAWSICAAMVFSIGVMPGRAMQGAANMARQLPARAPLAPASDQETAQRD